jgi:hypothetical protein
MNSAVSPKKRGSLSDDGLVDGLQYRRAYISELYI